MPVEVENLAPKFDPKDREGDVRSLEKPSKALLLDPGAVDLVLRRAALAMAMNINYNILFTGHDRVSGMPVNQSLGYQARVAGHNAFRFEPG